jgi:micrococcal nuclease
VSTPAGAEPTQARSTPRPVAAPADVNYANCDAVRAAGAAPIHRGDPGYSKKLDRDGDGVGCE